MLRILIGRIHPLRVNLTTKPILSLRCHICRESVIAFPLSHSFITHTFGCNYDILNRSVLFTLDVDLFSNRLHLIVFHYFNPKLACHFYVKSFLFY